MKELKDILNQMDAQPSTDCWDKLSQRLDMAMPTHGHIANASQQGASVGSKGIAALSTTAKVVTAVLSTAAVAGIITIASLTHQSDKSETTTPSTTESFEQTNSDPKTTETLFNSAMETSTSQVPKSDVQSNPINDNTDDNIAYPSNNICLEEPTSNTSGVKAINIKETSNITTVSTPTPTVTTAPQSPATTTTVQNAGSKTSKTQKRHVAQDNDPVIQNMDQESIDWNEPVKLEIPNVFTPNGDGYNDYFVIKGIENCGKRQLIVRNRAGHIVYRNNNYENTWEGSDCPNGVYTYQFFYSSNGIDQVMSGSVTILRK